MPESDAIHQRGQALEDEFFHRVDEKLRADLERSLARESQRQQLAEATGFQEQALLDHLLDAGFEATTLTALALVPMVFVAWADGSVTPQERQAVLSAAIHRGLKDQPTALNMLEGWLHKHPPKSLWEVWKEYVVALRQTLAPTFAEMLHAEIMRLSTTVAEASGGTLGFRKISKAEQAVLDEIAATAKPPA